MSKQLCCVLGLKSVLSMAMVCGISFWPCGLGFVSYAQERRVILPIDTADDSDGHRAELPHLASAR